MPQQKSKRFSREWWSAWEGLVSALALLVAVVALALPFAIDWYSHHTQQTTQLEHTPNLGVSFWQDGAPAYMADTSDYTKDLTPHITVTLQSDGFEMHFPDTNNNQDGLMVNAWTTAANFAVQKDTDTAGTSTASFDSPFHVGKALANTNHTDGVLYLNKDAYNYYDSERADTNDNNTLKVYFSRFDLPVPTHYTSMPDKIYTTSPATSHDIKSWKSNIYLTLWRDSNGDNIINGDEYEYVTLQFK